MRSGAVVYSACLCGLQTPLARMEMREPGPHRFHDLEGSCSITGFPDSVSTTVCPYASRDLPTPLRRRRRPSCGSADRPEEPSFNRQMRRPWAWIRTLAGTVTARWAPSAGAELRTTRRREDRPGTVRCFRWGGTASEFRIVIAKAIGMKYLGSPSPAGGPRGLGVLVRNIRCAANIARF